MICGNQGPALPCPVCMHAYAYAARAGHMHACGLTGPHSQLQLQRVYQRVCTSKLLSRVSALNASPSCGCGAMPARSDSEVRRVRRPSAPSAMSHSDACARTPWVSGRMTTAVGSAGLDGGSCSAQGQSGPGTISQRGQHVVDS